MNKSKNSSVRISYTYDLCTFPCSSSYTQTCVPLELILFLFLLMLGHASPFWCEQSFLLRSVLCFLKTGSSIYSQIICADRVKFVWLHIIFMLQHKLNFCLIHFLCIDLLFVCCFGTWAGLQKKSEECTQDSRAVIIFNRDIAGHMFIIMNDHDFCLQLK